MAHYRKTTGVSSGTERRQMPRAQTGAQTSEDTSTADGSGDSQTLTIDPMSLVEEIINTAIGTAIGVMVSKLVFGEGL